MVAAVLALVLLRLEQDGEAAAAATTGLTELFIDDMEASLRELGIGDPTLGKKLGKLVGALGGRLGSFREGLEQGGDFEAAVARNVFRGAPASDACVELVSDRLRAFHVALRQAALSDILAGRLP
jgi:cytochrome b pre-mRNA-processing protein 3